MKHLHLQRQMNYQAYKFDVIMWFMVFSRSFIWHIHLCACHFPTITVTTMVFLSWTGCQYFHFRSYFTIDNTFTGRAISQLTFRSWSHNAAKLGAHSGPLCNLDSSVPAFCFDLLQCIEQPRLEMLRKEGKKAKRKK